MLLNRIKNYLKVKKILTKFNKLACVGDSFVALPTCMVENLTGDRTRITIGNHCELACKIHVEGDGFIKIGNNTTARYGTEIRSTAGVTIGNDVIISHYVTIFDHNSHPTSPQMRYEMTQSGFHGPLWRNTRAEKKPIVIEDNVWIGQHATIFKGVTVGKGSIVAASAVVTKDVPPYSVAAGNPAKIVKTLEH